MKVSDYYNNTQKIDKKLGFFKNKKQLNPINKNKELVEAYLVKAKHNLEFFRLNESQNKFNDWLVVILYYSLYHCALALVAKKNFVSKNHTATLLFLIKEYGINKEEAELINELSLSKDDAEFYTNLKTDRHNASYATSILFSNEKIKDYKFKVVEFLQKTEEIIKNNQ